LINEGYVIEFNDGSLDLPRAKAKPKEETVEAVVPAAEKEQRVEAGAPPADELPEESRKTDDVVAAVVSTAEPEKQALETSASTAEEETEIGGS
jgi:hypothetical protein